MRTRCCLNCGEPFETDAQTDIKLPFCSKECREWHNIPEEEREAIRNALEYLQEDGYGL